MNPFTIADIIDFDFRCNGNILDIREGTAHDVLYVQSSVISGTKFNSCITTAELSSEIITEYTQRLISAGRKPSFLVLAGSFNEEICVQHGFEKVWTSFVMGASMSDREQTTFPTGTSITLSTLPYDNAYIDLMDEAFFSRGTDRDEWLSIFRSVGKSDDVAESVFTMTKDEKVISIAQTNNDYDLGKSFLYNVATKNGERNKGYSTALLIHAMNQAYAHRIDEMYLTTASADAKRLYEKLGFTRKATKVYYTQNQ